MNNLNLELGKTINLQVICNSKTNLIEKVSDQEYKLRINSLPIKGRANKDIHKFFKKKGYVIDIVKGEKSNHKIIQIVDIKKNI